MTPFEWLTSPSSLEPYLLKALHLIDVKAEGVTCNKEEPLRRTKKVLHVGCGTSALGEYLAENPNFRVETVVNADCEDKTLQSVQERWKARCQQSTGGGIPEGLLDVMSFVKIDFATEHVLPFPDGSFDLVVDKSTLDCTLCSEQATAGLILEAYRLLNPHSGVYLVVSFHQVDFLRPLLLVPGFAWNVNCFVMQRQVEDFTPQGDREVSRLENVAAPEASSTSRLSSSENGSFEPDEGYRRTVNVLLCQRFPETSIARVDTLLAERCSVARHVNETNDRWFQSQNPMLTPIRKEEIVKAFAERDESMVAIPTVYIILFTAEERSQYTFDFYLEDWLGYCTERKLSSTHMTIDVAIDFLATIQ